MRHFFQCVFFLLLLGASTPAETAHEAGERLYEEGRAFEAKLEFARAVAAYDDSLRTDPSGRWALAARARSDDLHAHSEGEFAPLTKLEVVRRGGAQTNGEALDALLRDAEGFPNGPVRSEARMLCAEGFLGPLARPADGKRALGLVLDDPSADPTIKHFAARRLADMALAEGRTADARDAATRADDPSLERRVTRLVRRGIAHRMSIGAIGMMLVLALVAIVRRRERPKNVPWKTIGAFSIVVSFGGFLASSYEQGNALPFVALAVAIAVLASVSAAWSSAGSSKAWARAGRAIVCGAAILGAGFLVLERIDARYLESFGL